MLKRSTPMGWRKDWTLCRSRQEQDSRGNVSRKWDTDHPDFVGKAGTASGVCWQIHSSEWALRETGEKATGGASFDLFLAELDIQPFDRCIFAARLWEVRSVLPRSDHRHIILTEVKAL